MDLLVLRKMEGMHFVVFDEKMAFFQKNILQFSLKSYILNNWNMYCLLVQRN